jgi:hypothetical protein
MVTPEQFDTWLDGTPGSGDTTQMIIERTQDLRGLH